jgi:hypothetical protein
VSTFELEIWDDEADKVTFYTVRWQDSAVSETDKFFEKHEKLDKKATQELLSLLIDSIGTDHGAVDEFFNRPEDGVTGLPPKGKITVDEVKFHYPQFPLRLYALRIKNREDLVVLFNGGTKSAETNQESPDLNLKFIEAKAFGKRIEQALYDGTIIIDAESRTLKLFDGSDTLVL